MVGLSSGGPMKALVLLSMIFLSFNLFAEDELPVIGEDAADEAALEVEPSNEVIVPTTAVNDTVVDTVTESKAAVVESAPINVDGYLKEKERPIVDPELQTIRSEIQKQKKEIVLNKVKAQKFKELGKSTEKLSETTEEMLLEKRAAQEEIANYNLKVKCLSQEVPGPECDKFNRKRR
jgi:hypothetical protein